MTGPGPGKIPIDGKIFLASRSRKISLNCAIYIHLKGYSNARITHIDIECPEINKFFKPSDKLYGLLNSTNKNIEIVLFHPIIIREPAFVLRKIVIISNDLQSSLGERRKEIVYIGGKNGGIFLGFKKNIICILEKNFSKKLSDTL